MGDVKTGIWIIAFVIAISLRLCWALFVDKNDLQHFVVVEYRTGKELTVKRDPGHYFIGVNIPHKWEWTNSVWFSQFDGEGDDGDNSVPLRYYDGAQGHQSGVMVYQFDLDTPDSSFIRMQLDYRSQSNFENRVVKPITMESLKKSASLLSSEDSYTIKKKEFGLMALDQLENRPYVTEVVRKEIKDITGEFIVADVPQIKIDTDKTSPTYGEKVRSGDKGLVDFHISVPVFSLYECRYDTVASDRIETKRSSKMDKIISVAKTKLAQKENYLEDVKGKVAVIKQEYLTKKNNAAAIIAAASNQDSIRIYAETRKDVAAIRLTISQMKKDISILEGNKEFTIRNLFVQSDNQLEDRVATWKKGQLAMATAYKKGLGIYPVIDLGDNKGGKAPESQAMTLFLMNEGKKALASSGPANK